MTVTIMVATILKGPHMVGWLNSSEYRVTVRRLHGPILLIHLFTHPLIHPFFDSQ